MGVPTSEVGYTSVIPRREDHEVHKDMWGHWEEEKKRTPPSPPSGKPQNTLNLWATERAAAY